MLEYSHGEIGWDVFILEYKVDAPIDTVLDPEAMGKYLRIFSHLWKMKRIEGALSAGWMRVAGGARTFLRVPGMLTPVIRVFFFTDSNRSKLRVAQDSSRNGRDDSLHSSTSSLLSLRSD